MAIVCGRAVAVCEDLQRAKTQDKSSRQGLEDEVLQVTSSKVHRGKMFSFRARLLAVLSQRTPLSQFCNQSPRKTAQSSLQRWSSNQSAQGPQPRKRFYAEVGVTEVAPPWEAMKKENESIENPISAGVDGTQSASGVVGHINEDLDISPQKQKELLTPRCTTLTDPSTVEPPAQWYAVTLDGRTLRTPVGQVLALPSALLAWAIAAEWDAQTTQIKPVQMPLMTLACTTLDQTAQHHEHYQKTALQYLPTDTVSLICRQSPKLYNFISDFLLFSIRPL